MFSGSEIKVHAKGSEYKTMDGTILDETNKINIEIIAIFPRNLGSMLDGDGIKVILNETKKIKDDKGKDKSIRLISVKNLKLVAGTIKCYSMTSLLTFRNRSKADEISIETLGYTLGDKFIPPLKYKYFVEFEFYYGIEGLIFWGWMVIGVVSLSLILVVRVFRFVSFQTILYHPKVLLEGLRNRMLEEAQEDSDEEEEGNWFVDLDED